MKIFNKRYKSIISGLILAIQLLIPILIFISILSCHRVDYENISQEKGIAFVKINLLGADYQDKTRNASQNPKQIILFNPSTILTAELNKELSKRTVVGDSIGNDVRFRVIAYRSKDNSYHIHQDYIVGKSAKPLMLDSKMSYTMIIYSYGNASVLPKISTEEITSLTDATIKYDDNNRDLMYRRIDNYIPDGDNPNNRLDVKLRHKLTQITTVINSKIGDIQSIASASLRNHYIDGTLSLENGKMDGRSTSVNQNLDFINSFPASSAVTSPVLINADTNSNSTGSYFSYITIGGKTKIINLPNSFRIIPEFKSKLTINLGKCGAYIAPGVWKAFMCHNLESNISDDPFTPNAAIHGAKYQWGAQMDENGRYYSQEKDQINSGVITGWNNIGLTGNPWNSNTETNPEKDKDPCPDGYRVPTRIEWQAVIDNNPQPSRLGSWENSSANYGAAIKFGGTIDNGLLLPAAGNRDQNSGVLNNRGSSGYYWSSTNPTSTGAYYLTFDISGVYIINSLSRSVGYSIRCISQ